MKEKWRACETKTIQKKGKLSYNKHRFYAEMQSLCLLVIHGNIWSKWKSEIFCVLAAKNILRYGQIRKEMYNSTDAVLAAT